MADDDTRDPAEGNRMARLTFILTVLLAAGFVGSVVFFILLR
jgi:hypothetical protein